MKACINEKHESVQEIPESVPDITMLLKEQFICIRLRDRNHISFNKLKQLSVYSSS